MSRKFPAPLLNSLFAGLVTMFAAMPAFAAISVTDAKIAGGRLIVTGTSDFGEQVLLDGYYTAEVTNKAFAFSVIYVPASCVVSLGAPGTTTPYIRAAIANCAPMPVNPAGEWSAETRYQPNDLVERQNSQYVALQNPRPNQNEDPLFSTSFWRAVPLPTATAGQTILIGAKGDRGNAGPAGRDGAKGDQGEKGDKGEDGLLANQVLHTIKAVVMMPPFESGQPKGDWKVTSSGSLAVTIAKEGHDPYAELFLSTASVPDPENCTFSGTVFDDGPENKVGSFGQLRKIGDTIVLPVRTTGDTTYVQAFLLCPKAGK